MFYLLFLFYLVVFCWLIPRIKFFSNSGLSNRLLIVLFLIRIAVALFANYFNLNYYPGSDTEGFHRYGILEYDLLFSNPTEYFTNIFQDTHRNNYSGVFDTSQSFWNDTKGNVIIKMLSIFNIFSGKNFYINILFYNFFIFFGAVALFKVFIRIFPTALYQLIACIFILPSALFFGSMIHRDGLVLLSLSIIVYHLFFMMDQQHSFSWKRISAIIVSLLAIFLFRNFVFITLIPALLAWMIALRKPKFAFISFAGVYIIVAIFFFCSGYISPKTDLPRFVSERQIAFIEISKLGASTININPLFPNFRSFFNNAPQALNHSMMRPYLTEISSFVYIPFSLEILLYEILFLLFLFYRKKITPTNPLIYFCFFFSVTMFLVIGYTVPIIGAIVRYRSIFFIFLLIPVICLTDWQKIRQTFQIKLKNI